jgi:Rad52/22 family double-strand break repair protein
VKVGELDYVDARYVMDRLDAEVGPANWQDGFRPAEGGGIVGRIGIYCDMGDGAMGQWVWKEDVGTESTIEAEKGAHSDAFKRAAVKWGIARDLYDTRDGQTGRGPKPAAGQSTAQTAARTGRPMNFPVPVEDAPWVCPEHGKVVAWPAGTSASGRKYDAFYACPVGRDCPHRAPAGLKVKPEHLSPKGDDLPF